MEAYIRSSDSSFPNTSRRADDLSEEANAALARANARLVGQRWRVSGALLVAGAVIFVVGFVGFISLSTRGVSDENGTEVGYYFTMLIAPGLALMLLAALPSDARIIRTLCCLNALLTLATGARFLILEVRYLVTGEDYYNIDDSSEITHEDRLVFSIGNLVLGVALSTLGAVLLFSLRLCKTAPPFCAVLSRAFAEQRRRHGAKVGTLRAVLTPLPVHFEDAASFAMPPRTALRWLWNALRAMTACVGLVIIITSAIVRLHLERSQPGHEAFLCGAIWLGTGLVCTRTVRHWTQRALRRLVSSSTTREAASLASLIGGLNPAALLDSAKANFRGIAFDRLCFDDFSSSTGSANLFARTQPLGFGEVDAFVSHSWSDDSQQKWDALSAWAAGFVKRQGRQPMLWIDKACIQQSNIVNDLPCLPIWLSASRRLVVMLGDSFVTRLWCAMELYTFVRISGSMSKMTVQVPGSWTKERALSLINSFDVEKAECTLQADHEHLLGVIESGFISFSEFNDIIRYIMTSAITANENREENSDTLWPRKQSKAPQQACNNHGSNEPAIGVNSTRLTAVFCPM